MRVFKRVLLPAITLLMVLIPAAQSAIADESPPQATPVSDDPISIEGELLPPTINEICGPDNDDISFTQPGVTYALDGWDSGTNTISFEAAEGHFLPDDAVTSHPLTDEAASCYESSDVSALHGTFENAEVGDIVEAPLFLYLDENHTYRYADVHVSHGGEWESNSPQRIDLMPGNGGPYHKMVSIEVTADMLHACEDGDILLLPEISLTHMDEALPPEIHTGTGTGWPCSLLISPVAPEAPLAICGPNNDFITIPDQPDGVTVSDTGWQDGDRTITYTPANAVVLPDGFQTTYTYSDKDACEAEISLSYPESLSLLTPNYQMTVTATYAFPEAWPEGITVDHRLTVDFGTNGFDGFTLADGSAGSLSIISRWTTSTFVELCVTHDGEIPATFSSTFWGRVGFNQSTSMTSYEETTTIDCSVALEPREATINANVCGYNDDRINVPEQEGITGHSITWDDNVATITYQAATLYEIVGGPFTLAVDPCIVMPLPPTVVTEVCGPDNDIISMPDQPAGLTIADSGWSGNERTFTFSAADGYALPEDFQAVQIVSDADTPCPTDAPAPPVQTQVCGPDNDQITIPPQPNGVTLESDSHWEDGTRTVTFAVDPDFETDGETEFTFTDENIACVIALTVQLVASDNGTLEGASWQLYAPVAAQNVGTEPFAEGTVGTDNSIVIDDLIAGQYRLVVNAEGYEPLDTLITVSDGETSQIVQLQIAALQPVETPTPSPTPEPTAEPTVESTVEVTPEPTQVPADPTPAPKEETSPVTGLPETGSGSGSGFGILALAGLIAAIGLGAIGNRRKHQS